MPLGARTRRGGNHAGGAQPVQWGRPKPCSPSKVFTPHADQNSRVCPTCKNLVGTRKDGQLRSHRIGKDRRNSWPCPGEEIYTYE